MWDHQLQVIEEFVGEANVRWCYLVGDSLGLLVFFGIVPVGLLVGILLKFWKLFFEFVLWGIGVEGIRGLKVGCGVGYCM